MNSIERLVLREIGEDVTNPDVFTTSNMGQIRDSINDAVQEITSLKGSHTEQFVIPLVTEKTFYRLSFQHGHFGWIVDAWLVNNKRRLRQTDRYQLEAIDPRWLVTTATPEAYMQIGLDVVGVYPKPSASSDVVECRCVVIPGRYEGDERVMLREEFNRTAAHYAVSEYYASRGYAPEAKIHWAKYLDRVNIRNNYFISPERKLQLSADKDPWPTPGERRPWA